MEDTAVNTSVLEKKLARTLSNGHRHAESAEEVIDRVARSLAAVEGRYGSPDAQKERRWYNRFRNMMIENRFWPSGRILNNAGTQQGQLASCFVLPIHDDFGSIFDTLKTAAACHRTGGGTGFDLTPLRERHAAISTAEAGGASGPVSWLRLFDAETTVVSQGGKMRGANLASLSVRHPDIFDFIDAKQEVGRLPNFNLSVSIDDDFMRAVDADLTVPLVSPLDGRSVRMVRARKVWDRICENAWRTGDPGILFSDTINRLNPLINVLGPIPTTNPCGEQTLYPYEASNLGSVNLATFARPDGSGVDWAALEETVTDAVRLLDNAIDACRYPDPRIVSMAEANRRLGLGVMGYADLLVRLNIAYDSESAMQLIERLGASIAHASWKASQRLAEERGTYPNWKNTGSSDPVRNCAIRSIAPTGTISMIANCSSGIEPRFAASWNKDVISADGIVYVDEELVHDLQQQCGMSSAEALNRLRETPVEELPLPKPMLAKYRYAHEISGEWHVRTVAQWQKFIDNAVSKTVNMPSDCTVTNISDALTQAWRLGCKGVSIYREGSRARDLMSVEPSAAESELLRQSKRLALSRP